MITVRIAGGLGNQMFQYAFARYLAHKHTTKIIFDTTTLDHTFLRSYTVRGFALSLFPLSYTRTYLSKAPRIFKEPAFIAQKVLNKLHAKVRPQTFISEKESFNAAALHAPDNSYLFGFWQDERYFKDVRDILVKEFTSFTIPIAPSAHSLLAAIKQNTAICVSFRRGDYVTNKSANAVHGVLQNDYYTQAVKNIAQKIAHPHFFIFSDDIAWCKENVSLEYPTTFVDYENTGFDQKMFTDFQLMYACKHYIISNSTFSWWAAWLNDTPNKIVIAPKQWYADKNKKTEIVPQSWIQL